MRRRRRTGENLPRSLARNPPRKLPTDSSVWRVHYCLTSGANSQTFFSRLPNRSGTKLTSWTSFHMSTNTKGNSSHVTISTNSLGDLDSSLRLSDYPPIRLPLAVPSTSACYGDDFFEFDLLLASKRPVGWRIEDAPFEPLVTLDTAMRYAKQVSDKSTEPIVKRNATRTLSILNYYKKGKPLPAELSSGASGGCG